MHILAEPRFLRTVLPEKQRTGSQRQPRRRGGCAAKAPLPDASTPAAETLDPKPQVQEKAENKKVPNSASSPPAPKPDVKEKVESKIASGPSALQPVPKASEGKIEVPQATFKQAPLPIKLDEVVFLERAPEPPSLPIGTTFCMLNREIIRQSFLLCAREDFGNAGYGQTSSSNAGALGATAGSVTYTKAQVYYANVYHNFTNQIRAGFEYAYFDTTYSDGVIAHNNRFQVSTWFRF